MALTVDKPPVIKITGPLSSFNPSTSLPRAKKPAPLLNLEFDKPQKTPKSIKSVLAETASKKTLVPVMKMEFNPRENSLFDNLNKYNDDSTKIPLSLGNPIMIRAVASKLDYSNEAFSFVQPSRNQTNSNESKSEQLPAR